jgi:hypothetical protein
LAPSIACTTQEPTKSHQRSVQSIHNFCIDEKERPPPLSAPTGAPPPMATTHTEREFNTDVIKNRSEWLTEYQFQRQVEGPCLRCRYDSREELPPSKMEFRT